MRIIPVVDVLGGVVVRAVAGRRHDYRPIVTPLSASAELELVAAGLAARAETSELYLADLDAITGEPASAVVTAFLGKVSGPLWLDRGWRTPTEMHPSLPGHVCGILASESLRQRPTLWPTAAAFSLDLYEGRVRCGWGEEPDPIALADCIASLGCARLIVLDLASVGTAAGPTSLRLIESLRRRHPKLELIGGGGVRDAGDLRRCADAGCDAVLVSTALHAGTIRLTPR